MVKNLNPFWTKKFGSISGGMIQPPPLIAAEMAVAAKRERERKANRRAQRQAHKGNRV